MFKSKDFLKASTEESTHFIAPTCYLRDYFLFSKMTLHLSSEINPIFQSFSRFPGFFTQEVKRKLLKIGKSGWVRLRAGLFGN
jgi:hypothetical protein